MTAVSTVSVSLASVSVVDTHCLRTLDTRSVSRHRAGAVPSGSQNELVEMLMQREVVGDRIDLTRPGGQPE